MDVHSETLTATSSAMQVPNVMTFITLDLVGTNNGRDHIVWLVHDHRLSQRPGEVTPVSTPKNLILAKQGATITTRGKIGRLLLNKLVILGCGRISTSIVSACLFIVKEKIERC